MLSIESSALRIGEQAGGPPVELFVSTEKAGIAYPAGLEGFLKPGAGVWTIERLAADSIAGLADAVPKTIVRCDDPRYLYVKDPTRTFHSGMSFAIGRAGITTRSGCRSCVPSGIKKSKEQTCLHEN